MDSLEENYKTLAEEVKELKRVNALLIEHLNELLERVLNLEYKRQIYSYDEWKW